MTLTVNDQILALTGFGPAAWQTSPRVQFIGLQDRSPISQTESPFGWLQCAVSDLTIGTIKKSGL
jgi:hypothetical protein